jgi:predicted transcriptional regulator
MSTTAPSDDGQSPTDGWNKESLLELLDDDHARAVLAAIATSEKSAPTLTDELDSSRATVYRRLNSLEDAGLVTSRLRVTPGDGHCQVYRATLDRVTVSLDADGLSVDLETTTTDDEGDGPNTVH